MKSRAGFIAVLGAPNAGKSTLVNGMVGTKVSIVSPKVQTTRRRVLGILCHHQTQIILIDTPGIFDGHKPLEKAMIKAAWEAPREADYGLLVVDVSKKNLDPSFAILERLVARKQRLLLCLNKIDLIPKSDLLAVAKELNDRANIEHTFMISALKREGIDDLIAYCATHLPEGPWLYEKDQVSDLPQRLFAAEITRESLFRLLHQELPYALTVETDQWSLFKNGSLKITQTIYVEKVSQKAIVLGKGGQKIKSVGEMARQELSTLLGKKIHLILQVKVDPHWLQKPHHYHEMGLDAGHLRE